MNTKENPQNSELTELREELDKGLDELAKLIYRAHVAKVESQTNIVLLSLIAICLFYLNVVEPLVKGAGSIASLSGQTIQRSVGSIASKIPFLPKPPTATGSLKVSGYWAIRAGRGDKFAGGRFTAGSPFGPRESPGGIGSTNHRGQDVPAPSGTPLYAVGVKGEQVTISCNWSDAGGNQAKLSAPSYSKSGITLGAAHLMQPCKSGIYQAGQVFGYVGSTGNSTGPHLHFAQKQDGQFVPPQRWGIEAMLSGRTLEGLR